MSFSHFSTDQKQVIIIEVSSDFNNLGIPVYPLPASSAVLQQSYPLVAATAPICSTLALHCLKRRSLTSHRPPSPASAAAAAAAATFRPARGVGRRWSLLELQLQPLELPQLAPSRCDWTAGELQQSLYKRTTRTKKASAKSVKNY